MILDVLERRAGRSPIFFPGGICLLMQFVIMLKIFNVYQ